jgi:hypothetical protein
MGWWRMGWRRRVMWILRMRGEERIYPEDYL